MTEKVRSLRIISGNVPDGTYKDTLAKARALGMTVSFYIRTLVERDLYPTNKSVLGE